MIFKCFEKVFKISFQKIMQVARERVQNHVFTFAIVIDITFAIVVSVVLKIAFAIVTFDLSLCEAVGGGVAVEDEEEREAEQPEGVVLMSFALNLQSLNVLSYHIPKFLFTAVKGSSYICI